MYPQETLALYQSAYNAAIYYTNNKLAEWCMGKPKEQNLMAFIKQMSYNDEYLDLRATIKQSLNKQFVVKEPITHISNEKAVQLMGTPDGHSCGVWSVEFLIRFYGILQERTDISGQLRWESTDVETELTEITREIENQFIPIDQSILRERHRTDLSQFIEDNVSTAESLIGEISTALEFLTVQYPTMFIPNEDMSLTQQHSNHTLFEVQTMLREEASGDNSYQQAMATEQEEATEDHEEFNSSEFFDAYEF